MAFPFELSSPGLFPYPLFMEHNHHSKMSFGSRLSLAVTCLGRIPGIPSSPARPVKLLHPPPSAKPVPAELPPERRHASGLAVLSLLQREGRLIDFLQEDVAAFSDAEVARPPWVVHAGCRRHSRITSPSNRRSRTPKARRSKCRRALTPAIAAMTGNVAGQPPFRGTLKHHGWAATSVRLPAVSEALDPRVLVAAEVEL